MVRARRVHLLLILVVAAALASLASAGLGLSAATGAAAHAMHRTGPGATAANRRAAFRDVRRLVARVRLPAGAVRSGSRPPGDHGYLKPLSMLEGDQAHVVLSRWWTLPSSVAQVLAYVRAHPPRAGRAAITGSEGNVHTSASAEMVTFEWPAVAHRLGYRAVSVTVTRLDDGRTGVLVEGQSDWIVVRARSERIPAGVHRIVITSRRLRATVTQARPVRRIVALINRLPVTQPIELSCPLMSRLRLIKIAFDSAAGRPLALVRYYDFWPWLAPSGACNPVQLTIGGVAQHTLVGGTFLRRIQKLVGRPLT